MPPHLKKVLNQARLETELYETMVQHLEREIELNGLATNDSPSITGVHNIETSSQQQQNNPPEQREHALGAATQVTSYETAGKSIGTNDPKKQTLQPNPLPARHVAK